MCSMEYYAGVRERESGGGSLHLDIAISKTLLEKSRCSGVHSMLNCAGEKGRREDVCVCMTLLGCHNRLPQSGWLK